MQNSLLDQIGNLFVYRSPPPMSGKRLRRFELMGELELTDSVETDKHALMERYHLVQGRNKTFLKPDSK